MATNYKDFFVPKQSQTTQQKVAEALGVKPSDINPNVNKISQTPGAISGRISGGSRSSGGGAGGGGSGGGVSQPSVAQIQADRNKQIADEKAKQEAFSRTGGIVGVGQISPYFKTGVQDIQTDSQAIRTATQVADQVSQEAKTKVTRTYGMKVNRLFGAKDIEVLETKDKTYYGIGEDTYLDEATFKQYAEKGSYPISSKTFTKQDIQTGKVDTIAQTKRIADIKSEESQFEFLGGYFAGGGKEIANIAGGVATKVVGAVARPIASALSPASKPIVQSTAQVIGNTADDIYKMLSPATQKVVSGVAKSSAAKATQKTATEATKFALGQVASAGGYIASAQSPEYGRQTYDFFNQDKATKFKTIEQSKEAQQAEAQYITNRTVFTFGGQAKDSEGKISDVKSKLDPISTYVYTSLPGLKTLEPSFQNKEELQTQFKDVPAFKKLSESEKVEYVDYKLGKIDAAFKAYIGGQLGAEMISNFAASKAKEQTRKLLPKGAGDLSKNIVSAATTSVYGAFGESPSQVFGEANLNRREVTNDQLLMSVAVGGASSAFFDFVPNQLRSSANTLLKESTETVVKSTGKKAVNKTTELVIKASGAGKNKLLATGVEWAGNILDLAEKPGDVGSDLLGFASGKVRTLAVGGFGIATASSKTKDQSAIYEGANQNSSKSLGIITPGGSIDLTGTIGVQPPVPPKPDDPVPPKPDDPVPPVPSKPDDEVPPEDQDKSQSNVPSNAFSNVPSTTAVIVPNRFWLPGFMPIGFGSKTDVRERTRIYDELSAAGKRFQQLSGLPFAQQKTIKRKKTVMINGKEFKIGKRVKK